MLGDLLGAIKLQYAFMLRDRAAAHINRADVVIAFNIEHKQRMPCKEGPSASAQEVAEFQLICYVLLSDLTTG